MTRCICPAETVRTDALMPIRPDARRTPLRDCIRGIVDKFGVIIYYKRL